MQTRITVFVLFACVILLTQSVRAQQSIENQINQNESIDESTPAFKATETIIPTKAIEVTESSETTETKEIENVTETSANFEKLTTLSDEQFTNSESDNVGIIPPIKEINLAEDSDKLEEVKNELSQSGESSTNPCDKCAPTDQINGIAYQIKNGTVNIVWEALDEDEPTCRYKYTTKMNQDSFPDQFFRVENFTGANIPTRGLCGKHTINISAINKCHNFVQETLNVVIPAEAFQISILQTTYSDAQIKIATNCNNLSKLFVECTASKNERKIDYERNFTIILQLDNLQAYTNYSCQGKFYKGDDFVGNNSFRFETKQTAPTEVRNIGVSNITESSFVLLWDTPENLNGILTEYEIQVEGVPIFDSPQFCKNNSGKYFLRYVVEVNKNFQFTDLPGSFEFSIKIRAKTIEYGPYQSINVSTLSPPPSEVDSFNYHIDASKINEAKAQLSWSYPCKTHADFNRILFSIHVAENLKVTRTINETMKKEPQPNFSIDLDLRPSTHYTIMLYTINLDTNRTSTAKIVEFDSPEGVTSEPKNLDISPTDFDWRVNATWEEPTYIFGRLLRYEVNLTLLKPQHTLNCNGDQQNESNFQPLGKSLSLDIKPNRLYSIQIAAVTSEMNGTTFQKEFATKPIQSEPIRNLKCTPIFSPNDSAVVNIQFDQPCDTNGIFQHFLITLTDEQGGKVDNFTGTSLTQNLDGLSYEMNYKASVKVINQDSAFESIAKDCIFKTFSGIPGLGTLHENVVLQKIYPSQVDVLLKDDYFDNGNGEVKYFAILVGVASKWPEFRTEKSGNWNGTYWPNDEFWNEDGRVYQATPEKWEPLKGDVTRFTYTLGTENCTGVVNNFCNGPLQPNTEYFIAIRGYTAHGYQISNKIAFVTEDFEKTQNVVLIVGITSGVLVVMLLLGFGCLFWRRRPNKPKTLEEANQIVNTQEQTTFVLPSPVRIEDFPAYYNEQKMYLTDEFGALSTIGQDLNKSIGEHPDNRKKNRYINIIPYNFSRVSLEGCKNDYINASYIKGYSEEIEYIATQGPLQSTVADFWQMVMKENCSVIAMVAQFEEQEKTKCHRYFPECREQMELYLDDGGEMMVRCSYALNYDYYIERQIIVQANERQLVVTHLQFLNWPDFGCPEGTTNMLQFTKRLRRHMEKNDSKAVVHCSAGIGRTGTLVAVDILLQTIRDGKDINIFGTVAALRRQRTRMVQAESQYFYIYQCILDEILQPMELTEIKPIDPIYENMENLIEMKVFSTQNNNCDTQIAYINELNQDNEDYVRNDVENDKTLNDEQNKINNKKNEETNTKINLEKEE